MQKEMIAKTTREIILETKQVTYHADGITYFDYLMVLVMNARV